MIGGACEEAIIVKQGIVWDGLDPSSDLHLADSSFPSNPRTFAYTNEAILLDTTQEPTPATSTLETKLNQTHPCQRATHPQLMAMTAHPLSSPLPTLSTPLQTPSILTCPLS